MRQTYGPEGGRWFEWPLTPDSVGETVSKLNHDRGWDLTMVAPARFGDVIIDREAGCLRARCAWKAKDPSQMGAEPSTYVKEA